MFEAIAQGWTAFWSINTTAFTVLDYPVSHLELWGTLFNLWSVVLVARRNIATWPVGLVGVALFLALFYQIRLYADTLEQVYYLFASLYGWRLWALSRPSAAAPTAGIAFSAPRRILVVAAVTALLSVLLGYVLSRIHLWLPAFFPAAAEYVYLDATTTVMSFTATILMARKRTECWWYWISVDVIAIGLYWRKDVRFIALEYVIFLVLAILGLLAWQRQRRPTPSLVMA